MNDAPTADSDVFARAHAELASASAELSADGITSFPAKPPAAPTTGRQDYDQAVSFHGVEAGEPTFMLRGRDAVSGDAVRAWVVLARAKGAPSAVLEQALRQADRLDAWPTKKTPDDGHIATEAERQQLTYALERRAWHARADCADLRVMLAEERAITAVRNSIRPLVREILERGAWIEELDPETPANVTRIAGDEPAATALTAFVFRPSDPDNNAIRALEHLEKVLRSPAPTGVPAFARALMDATTDAREEAERAHAAGDLTRANREAGRMAAFIRAGELLLEIIG